MLRRELRQRRRDLSETAQRQAGRAVAELLSSAPAFQDSQHIALYLAADGELDLAEFIEIARGSGKSLYLPAIENKTMSFRRWSQGDSLVKGGLGIEQPHSETAHIELRQLELVLTPLVGFDRQGLRLGMGGGYYDRCFAGRPQSSTQAQQAPQLLGVAHSLQECEDIPQEKWDQRLDGVITEQGIDWF